VAPEAERTEICTSMAGFLPEILHTKDGAKAAAIVYHQLTAKVLKTPHFISLHY
jgi:hypothetical protein